MNCGKRTNKLWVCLGVHVFKGRGEGRDSNVRFDGKKPNQNALPTQCELLKKRLFLKIVLKES